MGETDDGYVVTAEMPEFERADTDLTFEDGSPRSGATDRSRQRRSRHVHERPAVPGDVREADLDASSRNGVLAVHLPTGDEVDADAHRIDVDRASGRR